MIDLVAITFALAEGAGYIDEEVDARAKELLAKVFDKDVVAKLECFGLRGAAGRQRFFLRQLPLMQ